MQEHLICIAFLESFLYEYLAIVLPIVLIVKELSRQHPAYLEDTRYFLSYIDGVNKEIGPFNKEKLWFIIRDIVNYYPSCGTEMCVKAVGQLLDTRKENIPEKQCILDALAITMTSNSCNFMGKYFTQVDGATIGGQESASVTDIYGAVLWRL